jgi:predicted metal-dependent phosphoesterase TrpH
MRVDLHTHTTASDGALAPEELVRHAVRSGLEAIAITDHDSVEGIQSAWQTARELPLDIVPGVELSAVHEGADVHILGFFIDHRDPTLLRSLAELRECRHERAERMVIALRDAGYDVTLDDVLALAEGGSVGRSHVARALVGGGHAESVADAFERLIGRGRPFYVPKPVAEPPAVVDTIISAGGVPVLAHPGITQVDHLIPTLVDAGLAGLEAYHGDHTPEMRERYARMADDLGLVATGGSDYHGPDAPGVPLGAAEVPEDTLSALRAIACRTNVR